MKKTLLHFSGDSSRSRAARRWGMALYEDDNERLQRPCRTIANRNYTRRICTRYCLRHCHGYGELHLVLRIHNQRRKRRGVRERRGTTPVRR